MKRLKGPKPPLLVDAAALWVQLACIAVFSVFVVWQWCYHTPSQRSFTNDRAMTFPLDQGATFSNEQLDSSSDILPNPDQPARIDDDLMIEAAKCCRCAATEESIGGAALLHNWTDQELFGRAIAAATVDCSRFNNVSSGLPANAGVIQSGSSSLQCSTYCAKKGSVSSEKVKIAFLFMITTSLPFEPLWKKFFEGKEGLYNIYVHADPFRADLFNETSGVFYHRLIPSRKAFRGSPSLVLASNRLAANAMLDDPLNQYFALLSGQCIPVRSFDHVYNVITGSQQSFLEQIRNESVMWERYTGRDGGEELMLPEIAFDQFRKAAQWFVFIRRHALMILQDVHDRKYWGKFDHECVIYFCGTDEHYYPTTLNILDPGGATGTTTTYVAWPDWVSEHPIVFERWNITEKFIKDIQAKDGGQYLFARKFAEDTVDLLMDLVDAILR